eukprot:jgi/Chlat1/2323/Chrsp17S02609
MADAAAAVRAVKIKAGSLARVAKELASYEKEHVAEQAKTEKLKAQGAEPHDIKQQENVLAESAMMVPDSKRRLEAAYRDLQTAVAGALKHESGAESEEVKSAQKLLEEHANAVQ